MRLICISAVLVFLLAAARPGGANEPRLKAMGNIWLSVPDVDARINLFQVGGNSAWLKMNDSLSWMRYGFLSANNWGNLRRRWDARRYSLNTLAFEGQKHLSGTQIFFGRLDYVWDSRFDMRGAIEMEPYAGDPFVLADSTEGNINFTGPQVVVAYNQQLSRRIYWGTSLFYSVRHGLKKEFTRPEIIDRRVQVSLDLAWKISDNWVAGVIFQPRHRQNVSKFVTQPDGSEPVTYRYRGEFIFRQNVGTQDRNAVFKGWKGGLQLAVNHRSVQSFWAANYQYQWHELFDGSIKHNHDGYYQARSYTVQWLGRYFPQWKKNTIFSWSYTFKYLDDWAREPNNDLMIYRALYRVHDVTLGASKKYSRVPLLLAAEGSLYSSQPQKRDYLAHRFRQGPIRDIQLRLGMEINYNSPFRFRTGYIYSWHREAEVWQYFKDYQGPAFTMGFGLVQQTFEIDGYGLLGKNLRTRRKAMDQIYDRRYLDFKLTVKYFF